MHRRQRPQDGDHDVQRLVHRYSSARVADVALEADPLDVVHDEIGGIIGVKVAGHARDVGMSDKLGQGPGLLLEALRPVGKVVLLGVHSHGDGSPLDTGGDVVGHVLLHGHLGLELCVEGQVGDTESALTQDAAYDIPVVQHRSGPEGHGEFFRVLCQVEPAIRTGALRTLPLGEAVIAEVLGGCWHDRSSLRIVFFRFQRTACR